VDEPRVAFGLRNPDIYVAGERVEMVSSAAALASQVPGLTEEQATSIEFFAGFYGHPDRIGWWLRLPPERVPGEDAGAVARRVAQFAASLADLPGADDGLVTVGVTHSPILRAVALAHLGDDLGEPEWVTGVELTIGPGRSVAVRRWPGASFH
jgi:broad specificity phosphatase PhoE